MTNIESEAKKKKCQKQTLNNVDLNEESQNRNAGLNVWLIFPVNWLRLCGAVCSKRF